MTSRGSSGQPVVHGGGARGVLVEDDLLDVADAFFELDPALGQREPLQVDPDRQVLHHCGITQV